jgi:hypothetical protein
MHPRIQQLAAALALCSAGILITGPAAAGSGDRERARDHRSERSAARSTTPLLPLYQRECGSCHLPYAPGLLPAPSWQRQMAGLRTHYGNNASLDAADLAAITRWLQDNAGTGRRVQVPPPQDRITHSAWFVRKHDEVPRAAMARAGRASSCQACHTQAAEGRFSEHDVRLPR